MTIELGSKEHMEAAYKALIVPLAKYVHNEELLDSEIDYDAVLESFLKETEVGETYKVEVHIDTMSTHLNAIKKLTKSNEYLAAAILTAVTLEENINGLMRVGCTAEGFEHKAITRFIQETGIKTKIELTLPLLGIEVNEPHKNVIFEFLPLRNSSVHGKAIPTEHTDVSTRGSIGENKDKAKKLMNQYPIEKIVKYTAETEASVFEIPEISLAHDILANRLHE